MKVFIATDIRINEISGRWYLPNQVYSILKRYYEAFGPYTVCSRAIHHQEITDDLIDVSDFIDKFIEIESLEQSFAPFFLKKIKTAVDESDLIIVRVPSLIGMRIFSYAKKRGKKCFAEVMGDVWDAYWNHSIVGKVIAPYAFLATKNVVYNSDYALYVTNKYLQNRYPCRNKSVGVSNVIIDNFDDAQQKDVGVSDVVIESVDEAVLQKRLAKIVHTSFRQLTLMTTAGVDVRYKGQQFVIKAIPILNKAGIRVRYVLVGGGDQAYLKGVARQYGVEDQVEFAGRRSLTEVFDLLDTTDFYIQPSLQEGLPRAVVEAMSRGCPVIGAKTGGIPELVAPECVAKRKSAKEIAEKIIRFANQESMSKLAEQNFEKSKEYRDSVLSARRNAYFKRIAEEIERHGEWKN